MDSAWNTCVVGIVLVFVGCIAKFVYAINHRKPSVKGLDMYIPPAIAFVDMLYQNRTFHKYFVESMLLKEHGFVIIDPRNPAPESKADTRKRSGSIDATIKTLLSDEPLAVVSKTKGMTSDEANAAKEKNKRQYTVHNLKYRPAVALLNYVLGVLQFLRLSPVVDADGMIEEVKKQTGLKRYSDPEVEERLRESIRCVNKTGLTPLGKMATRGMYVKAIWGRMGLEHYVSKLPEVKNIQIKRPIFILGFPRTGTTLLQNMFSLTSKQTALRMFEVTQPVPLHDDPVADARSRMADCAMILHLSYFVAPEMREIHELHADSKEECWPLFLGSAAAFTSDLMMGNKEYGDHLLKADMTGPYRQYKEAMQVSAHRRPTEQFVMKCPEHLWFLDALLKVFPDACIVWTHR